MEKNGLLLALAGLARRLPECRPTGAGILMLLLVALMPLSSSARVLPEPSHSLVEQVLGRQLLRVGLTESEPWVIKGKDGQLRGFDIDVARKLAEELGVRVEFAEYQWQELIPALLDKRIDIIISGMVMTTPRNLKVNFTLPYANSRIQVLANRDLMKGIQQVTDLNQPEVKLALLNDSIMVSLAKQKLPLARLLLLDSEEEVVAAVKSGRAHATLATSPVPARLVDRFPRKLLIPDFSPLQRYSESFAIRKSDPDSLNVLNNWIVQRLEDGWLQERHDYWFFQDR